MQKKKFLEITQLFFIPNELGHLEVAVHAGVAEGVATGRVHRLNEGLQADLAHQVLVHFFVVVVQVGLMVRVVLYDAIELVYGIWNSLIPSTG